MLPKSNRGFAFVPLLLIIGLVVVFLVSLYFYIQRSQETTNVKGVNSAKKVSLISQIIQSSTPTSVQQRQALLTLSPWKIYKNEEYGIEITYPRVGVVWTKGGLREGECGFAIKEESSLITLDNLYKLKAVSFTGSLEAYLTSQGAYRAYEIEDLIDSGADEAVRLVKLKPDFEVAVGYPPLAYVKAVFKKGEKIFLLQEIIHNPSNEGGCILPSVIDPTQFSDIAKQDWDIVTSLKFF